MSEPCVAGRHHAITGRRDVGTMEQQIYATFPQLVAAGVREIDALELALIHQAIWELPQEECKRWND